MTTSESAAVGPAIVPANGAAAESADKSAIYVLADWNVAEKSVLVAFADSAAVQQLHGLVTTIWEMVRKVTRVAVWSASIEASTSQVRAYSTDAQLEPDGQGLGDGLLLSGQLARALMGGEVNGVTIEVRDDGMLLIWDADHEDWAQIDLTQLASVVAGRE